MSKNGKRRKHTIVDKNDILECQSLIWKVIRDRYLEDEGGVYINNIGYLCHKINPNRKIYLNKLTGTINRRGTGGYSYVHTCMDFMPRNKYFHLYICYLFPTVMACPSSATPEQVRHAMAIL